MELQKQNETVKERICSCARKLFMIKGYDQVSMRLIASEAAIAVGNVTYYFPKKEDILREILKSIQTEFYEKIHLFAIDLETQEISGKPFWEYENKVILELLFRFLNVVEQFQNKAAIVYENYSILEKKVPAFREMNREWKKQIMTIYNVLMEQLWERRIFRKELEKNEYENMIYILKLLTFFWQEMQKEESPEKKRFVESICRFLSPYISWEWKETYTDLCREICEVSFHRKSLKFI